MVSWRYNPAKSLILYAIIRAMFICLCWSKILQLDSSSSLADLLYTPFLIYAEFFIVKMNVRYSVRLKMTLFILGNIWTILICLYLGILSAQMSFLEDMFLNSPIMNCWKRLYVRNPHR